MNDSISRQEALDAFSLSEKTRKWGGDHSGYNTLMLYEIQDILEALPSAEPKWIPVVERLPEENFETGEGVQYSDYVLMSVEHNGTEVTIADYGYTVDGKWYSAYADCFISQEWKVTAWMPLPEPYRGE